MNSLPNKLVNVGSIGYLKYDDVSKELIFTGPTYSEVAHNILSVIDTNQNLSYNGNSIKLKSEVTFGAVTTSALNVNGDVDVKGDLHVEGKTTSIQTTNLDIKDNLISLNDGVTGVPTNDSGILIERGG